MREMELDEWNWFQGLRVATIDIRSALRSMILDWLNAFRAETDTLRSIYFHRFLARPHYRVLTI